MKLTHGIHPVDKFVKAKVTVPGLGRADCLPPP